MSTVEAYNSKFEHHFVIYDCYDKTFHLGEGCWGPLLRDAEVYNSRDKAREGIRFVDCDEILRHRLRVVPVQLEPAVDLNEV